MSYYRDVYLRSEDWKNLRAAKLHKQRFRCELCGSKSMANDVHHLKYKQLFDVKVYDLMVLCRTCHKAVHCLLEKYPGMKRIEPWAHLKKLIKLHLHPVKHGIRLKRAAKYGAAEPFRKFCMFRRTLISSGLICKHRMPPNDSLLRNQEFIDSMSTPESMLESYIAITMRDPRKWIIDVVRQFPK